MIETVTVDEALAKGRRMINTPAAIILCTTFISPLPIEIWHDLPAWIYIVSFVAGVTLSWLYWSITITKWRRWAFSNVRNVHELQKRAIKAQLIWPNDSFLERTEIRSSQDKIVLKEIESKFSRPDVFIDDFSVPNETLIYFSKVANTMELAVGILVVCTGIYLLIGNQYILGSLIMLAGIWYSVKEFRQLINSRPQIIISNKGLQIATAKEFYSWDKIHGIEVEEQNSGNNTSYYLTYKCPEGNVEIKIDDLKIKHTHLESLIHLYKARYTNNNKTSPYAHH